MNLKFLNTEEGSRSWHFWPQVWIPLTRVHSPKPIRILKVSGYLYIGWGMEGVSTVDFLQLCWLSCHHFENQDIAGNKYWKWWPAPIIPSEHKNDDQRLLYLLNTKMTISAYYTFWTQKWQKLLDVRSLYPALEYVYRWTEGPF